MDPRALFPRHRPLRHERLVTALLAAFAVLVLAGCAGVDDAVDDTADEAVEERPDRERTEAEEAPVEAPADADDAAAPAATDALPDPGPATGQYLVRDGSLVLVYDGAFGDTYDELGRIAERLGGSVGDIDTGTGPDGAEFGTVELEVPVEAYEELLADVAALGKVERRDIRTEDVTGEHVDLTSRLRHAEALEDFYLELYEEAETVDDALAISEHLERVQERIEQLRGRLDALEERAATSTLRVELVPAGYDADDLEPDTAAFAGYWTRAADGFVQVAGTLLVVAVGAVPVLALAAALGAGGLAARRAWRRSTAT